jgi:hypothetical protein
MKGWKIMIYDVVWHLPGKDQDYLQSVQIIPGYTTVADIPVIIAVSRTGRQSDAGFILVDSAKVSLRK